MSDVEDTWPGHWCWSSHEGNWADWDEPVVGRVLGMTSRVHETDGRECWCEPELLQPCPECEVEEGAEQTGADCWRCGGRGLVPAYDPEEPVVIVHAADAPEEIELG